MRPVLIGTAGHIDHGKSSLIRALTGTDPDRLLEEKQRGMTIDIGFAFLNENIAFIDVPGHEKFVKNMVTGSSSIDTGLLVIAADDGIMPQTREHFDILRLLNVRRGLIVITKTDLADTDWTDLVEEEIREFVQGSFLENSKIFRVSSVNGNGIEELKQYLLRLPDERILSVYEPELFRLPIDRVFSSRGYGTVVTGTVISGRVRIGEELELLPLQKPVKVRGIQSHNLAVNEIGVGHRAAINIQGVEHGSIKRGNFLAVPGCFKTSKLLTCAVNLLATSKPLKYNSVVRVHIGTSEYMGRIRLIGPDRLSPGESAIAQLIFDQPLSAGFRDRFIIRQYSPMITVGGGVVLDAMAKPLRKKDQATAESLDYLINCEGTDLISRHLDLNALKLYSERELTLRFSIPPDRVRNVLAELAAAARLVQIDKSWTSPKQHESLRNNILNVIREYHRKYSLSMGISQSELLEAIKIPLELINYLLKQLADDRRIKISGEKITLFEFQIEFSDIQQRFIETLETDLKQAGFNPPDLREIHQRSPLSEKDVQLIIAFLMDESRIVQIDRDKFIHREILDRGGRQIRDYLTKNQSATVSELKDVLNTSRKWAIPILNHYDKIGLTTRVGDQRELSNE
ncbi:selenocysteine-specific translation elongation factor [bacterium]|nr:selenocysteine-specific translation elongation factor [bacterium]MBU1633828.1 selenocysteine-specific translation elongation factor [bacterium]MBU1872915.1 selenocysteine-specific translation elongation factor [bacterium]